MKFRNKILTALIINLIVLLIGIQSVFAVETVTISDADQNLYKYNDVTGLPSTIVNTTTSEIGSSQVYQIWYYVVQNNKSTAKKVEIDMYGAANSSSKSSRVVVEDSIPANTTRMYLYDLITGVSSRETTILGSVDITLNADGTIASTSNETTLLAIGMGVYSVGNSAVESDARVIRAERKVYKFGSYDHYYQLILSNKVITIGGTSWTRGERYNTNLDAPNRGAVINFLDPWNNNSSYVLQDACYCATNTGTWYIANTSRVTVTKAENMAYAGLKGGKITLNIQTQEAGSISYGTTSVTKTYGDAAFTNALTKTGDGTVTYKSSNTNVATVDSAGKVTIKAAGSATITATVADTENYAYATKTATYTLTVNRASINKPTGTNRTYNGSSQTGLATGTGYTVGGTTSATNVGSYTATATPTANYKWSDGTTTAINVTWSIGAKAVTITAKAQTITYGGSITTGTGQVDVSGLVSGHSLTAITLKQSTTNATTTGTITPSAATIKSGTTDVTSNYSITYKTGALTINRASINKPTGTNRTYNGSAQTGLSAGTGYTVGGTTSATNVGSYTATATPTANYKWSDGTTTAINVTWSIGAKAVTITAKAQTITYGGSITTGTGQVDVSGLVSGHSLTAITLKQSTTNATTTGTITPSAATIKSGSTDVTSNYSITYKTGALTINRKAISKPTGTNRTYNGSAQTGLATGTGYTVGGTASATNVGSYTATATPTSNYQWSDGTTTAINVTWSIGAKAVTITAKAQTITYGDSIATGTTQVDVNGLVSGHSLTAITLTPSAENVTTTGIITPKAATIKSGSTDVTSNYSIKYKTGTLTINKKVVTVTANAQTITYGGSIATGVAQAVLADQLTNHKLTAVTLTPSISEAGEGVITPSAATIKNGTTDVSSNYEITYKTGKLIINKKEITVTWKDTALLFKNKDIGPTVTTPINGVNGEKINLTVSGQQTNVGTHTATVTISTVTGGKADPNNYSIKNPTQSYTISPDPNIKFVITLSQYTYDYEGKAQTPGVTVKATVDGKELTLVKDTDYTVGYTDNVDAGTATVTITGIKNYGKSSGTVTFTINKIDLVVTPNINQSKVQKEADPTLKYTWTGNLTGEEPKFSGALSREPGEEPGFYKITIGNLNHIDNNPLKAKNYNLVFGDPNVIFVIEYTKPLITDWTVPVNADGSGKGTTIKLPIPYWKENKYIVMWGDGTAEKYEGEEFPTHNYKNTTNQTYEVRVSGYVDNYGYNRMEIPSATNTYADYSTFTKYVTALKSWGEIGVSKIGFSQCTNLAGTIPSPTGLDKVISVENLFNECEKLKGPIPENLFATCPEIITARNMFKNCISLEGNIPAKLFENNTKITTFEDTFRNCKKLSGTIPTGLFNNKPEVVSYAGTFNNCINLEGVLPENLFASSTKAETFKETFANCAKLKSPSANADGIVPVIPEDLFKNNKYALNYYRTFYNCTGLSGAVTDEMFNSNVVIDKIPEDVTINSNYRGTFEGCTGVQSVENTLLIIGHEMFKGCTSLTDVTLNNVIDIGNEAFYGCNKLTEIEVPNNYLKTIGKDAFEYTGTNPEKLITYITADNEVLTKYDWAGDKRIVDFESPRGTVEIVTSKYPFTKIENVQLKITVEDNYSKPENCEIAIINENNYNEGLDLEKLSWQDYSSTVNWTLSPNDEIKTVYVFFRDEFGNVEKIAKELIY